MEVIERVLPLIKQNIKEGYSLGYWRITEAGDICFGITHNPPFINEKGKDLAIYASLRDDASEREIKLYLEHMIKHVDQEKERNMK